MEVKVLSMDVMKAEKGTKSYGSECMIYGCSERREGSKEL